MKTKPETGELPADLASVAAIAAAADADLDSATVIPGQEPVPEVDKAAELGDMLHLAMLGAGKMLPPLPKYFTREACAEIGTAYMECTEKYGWTVHEKLGGPELHLVVALAVPTFGAVMETRAWIAWQREQRRLAENAPAPAPAAGPAQ